VARKPPRDRSEDANRIARQWEDAHRRDPRLTKGEFAQRVFPPAVDQYGRPKPRSRRSAAGLLNAILAGRADDAASGLLEQAARDYYVTVGGEDDDGNTVWVVNALVESGKAPGDLDDTPELLAFIRSAYDRRIGSPPNTLAQGAPPIVNARVYRVPASNPGYISGRL
jgi:hypothetical protein